MILSLLYQIYSSSSNGHTTAVPRSAPWLQKKCLIYLNLESKQMYMEAIRIMAIPLLLLYLLSQLTMEVIGKIVTVLAQISTIFFHSWSLTSQAICTDVPSLVYHHFSIKTHVCQIFSP
jgi:hypothetical protein